MDRYVSKILPGSIPPNLDGAWELGDRETG
jgi:hypothetical protein